MSSEAASAQKPSVDPGCLPAWDTGEMPHPPKVGRTSLLRMLGPGLVLAGGSIGTGEWVMGPQNAARYQGAFLWAILFSTLAQVVLNTEVMRYTLMTGEPVMTGFLRSKPGPKFWLVFYVLLDFSSLWPSLAGLSAQILTVMIKGLGPNDAIDPEFVRMLSYFIFAGCATLVLFGGKVFNMLQVVITGKVLFTLVYLTFCCVFFVSASTWARIWGGLFNFTSFPVDPATGKATVDWALVATMSGFAGVGGLGNIMVSNFVREKGWGMGARVGAIPSAFGGVQIHLSHLGTMAEDTPTTVERFHQWFKTVKLDQYFVWFGASLIGMMLPCLLGAQYLNMKGVHSNDTWRWAAALAQDFGAAKGHIFTTLTLICGLVIMMPGQFYVVDNVARRWTDAIWSGLKSVRSMDTGRVKYIYYGFAGAYVVWGLSAYTFFPNMSAGVMMKIGGSLANFSIAMTILHTAYVNRRFLPKGVQPSNLKQGVMVLSALYFLVMFGLVVNQNVVPLLLGR
jgi:hypothetical protein